MARELLPDGPVRRRLLSRVTALVDELRTYYVDMGRNTGRVTYPAGARGMNQTFTHVVIQLRTTPRGTESLRIFEPGPGPGADAQPMLPRAR